MPVRFTCANGHAAERDAIPATCPVCAAPVTPAPPVIDDSTLLVVSPSTLLSAPSPFPALADFRVVGELGRGGMGIVYKAVHLPSDAAMAVKVIRKDRLQHDEAVRRFRREAQAASRLNHPNIVRVIDSDHTGDTHFLAMEYVPGVTLERYVEQHGPIPYDLAVDFMRQAARGLGHAHEQGLVHRDIKPSNLMITPASGRQSDGAPALLKVLDMGVARVLTTEHHPGEALSTLTQGGSVIGTADFVAPEQLEDPHGADIRADLYSLGCTFHFVLTGQVPFPGGSLVSKLDKQRWETPPRVDALRPEILPAVADVVLRLLEKAPAQRYASPAELTAALDELVRTNYLSHTPPAPAPHLMRSVTAHAGGATTAALTDDGRRAVSAGRDLCVRVWTFATGESRLLAKAPQETRAVALTPLGDVAAGAVGVGVRVWDVASGAETRRFAGHTAPVRAVAFAEDGRWLVSGGDDRTVRVWDLQFGREAMRFVRHTGPVTCLVAHGERVLSGSRDQSLRLWNLRTGQESTALSADGGPVLATAVSGDGRFAVSAHFDTILRVWNLTDGVAFGELHGHRQMPTGVGFLPDGKTLISTGQDRSVRWWDMATGQLLAETPPLPAAAHALAAARATRTALVAAADGSLTLFEIPER